MTTTYDDVRYPSHPFPQTHPSRLGAAQALLGAPPAPLAMARVLEIGCGEAANIIPLALAFPDATIVGFDLAATAIDEGRRIADRLGLKNIRLEALDILDAGPDLGVFDYIIVHGVYSWVPDAVRDGVMRTIKACLAPSGVAFVSYAALPGCNMRLTIRQMLLQHLKGLDSFEERVPAARQFLEFYLDHGFAEDPSAAAIRGYCEAMLKRDPHVLFHDELGPFYEPRYFHQFIDHARGHDLDFLAESDGPWWREDLFPSARAQAMARVGADDVLGRQQYLDFLAGRLFRQTMLRHASLAVDRRADASRVRGLYVHADVRTPKDADLSSGVSVRFEIGEAGVIALEDPALKQALHAIGQAAPQPVAVAALPDHPDVDEALLQLFAGGHVKFYSEPFPLTLTAGERPLASPLARLQLAEGALALTALDHGLAIVDGSTTRHLLAVLDGTRTRDELLAWMIEQGGEPEAIATQLDEDLQTLGKLGLLAA